MASTSILNHHKTSFQIDRSLKVGQCNRPIHYTSLSFLPQVQKSDLKSSYTVIHRTQTLTKIQEKFNFESDPRCMLSRTWKESGYHGYVRSKLIREDFITHQFKQKPLPLQVSFAIIDCTQVK